MICEFNDPSLLLFQEPILGTVLSFECTRGWLILLAHLKWWSRLPQSPLSLVLRWRLRLQNH